MTLYRTLSYVESYQVKNTLLQHNYSDVTMATIGFGPYHGLWLDDSPTKRIGIIPTPCTMMRVLGFVDILQAHE